MRGLKEQVEMEKRETVLVESVTPSVRKKGALTPKRVCHLSCFCQPALSENCGVFVTVLEE